MIIDFDTMTYKSFANTTFLGFIGEDKLRKHKEHLFRLKKAGLKRFVGIYGDPKTGRTGYLSAYEFISRLVKDDTSLANYNFINNQRSEACCRVNIDFIVDNQIYYYSTGFFKENGKINIFFEKLELNHQDGNVTTVFLHQDKFLLIGTTTTDEISNKRLKFYDMFRENMKIHPEMTFLSYSVNNGRNMMDFKAYKMMKRAYKYLTENIIIVGHSLLENHDIHFDDIKEEDRLNLLNKAFSSKRKDLTFIIDDFDYKLEDETIKNLMDELLAKSLENNSQYIFTISNPVFLTGLLRKDEIYFIDKDKYGVSIFYPLLSFELNPNHDLAKDYLKGKFKKLIIKETTSC